MKTRYAIGGAIFAVVALLLLSAYPYTAHLRAFPFLSGADTVGAITDVDTVEWQMGHGDLANTGAWNQLSTYITAANKSGEETVVYGLANETNWTWAPQMRVRIVSPSGTLTSGWIYVGNRAGAITLFVQPDTVTVGGADTTLYKVRLGGQ